MSKSILGTCWTRWHPLSSNFCFRKLCQVCIECCFFFYFARAVLLVAGWPIVFEIGWPSTPFDARGWPSTPFNARVSDRASVMLRRKFQLKANKLLVPHDSTNSRFCHRRSRSWHAFPCEQRAVNEIRVLLHILGKQTSSAMREVCISCDDSSFHFQSNFALGCGGTLPHSEKKNTSNLQSVLFSNFWWLHKPEKNVNTDDTFAFLV